MSKNRGFTLIEIMVVISIIIILAGLLMPAFNRARQQARRVECINNLKQIGIGLNSYALDYDGSFPGNLATLTANYLGGEANIIKCPATGGYTYTSGLTISNTANTVIVECNLSTAHPGPKGKNVLCIDGRVTSK